MKTGILKLTAILGVLAVASACSSTRTQQSAGEVIDDSTLTSKVKVALIDDPVTKAGQINVETYRGVVQLGGFVDNAKQKDPGHEDCPLGHGRQGGPQRPGRQHQAACDDRPGRR